MRQKLITLCPNSFEIAQKKPNFSSWVRKKLLEETIEDETTYQWHYQCPLCHELKTFPNQELEWKCNMCNIKLDCLGRLE